MFDRNFYKKIEELLSQHEGEEILISDVSTVSGGSINYAYCLTTNNSKYFIKTNKAKRYPAMFVKEASGLNLLINTKAIKIPKVILFGEFEDDSFLILEHIKSENLSSDFWESFGKQLAHLHQNTNTSFGLKEDNYIGSLNQPNNSHNTWTDFFINERLETQIKLARDNNRIDAATISRFENLFYKLDEIFPLEKPSLLHGDLWSGNFMVGDKGEPVIMDPAVYYGHREIDIAMTKLFGGFDTEFYKSYIEQSPLEKGWEKRIEIYNLYPLMVHVNLFGGGYLEQVKSILSKF